MADILLDFLNKPSRKVPMLIGRGILPVQGKMILGGAPKANKSFVALNIAMGLVTGKPLFNAYYPQTCDEHGKPEPIVPVFKVFEPVKVLYFEQEIGEDGLKDRLLTMLQGELASFPLYIASKNTKFRLDDKEGIAAIQDEIEQVKPQVVIFDPLTKFHLQDENSATSMGGIMRTGDQLVERYKLALIYVHHFGKASFDHPRSGGDELRGSSALYADVDTFLKIQRVSNPSVVAPLIDLSFELRRGKPLNKFQVRREENGLCTFIKEFYEGMEPQAAGEAKAAKPKKQRFAQPPARAGIGFDNVLRP